jgi:hypothetical protein
VESDTHLFIHPAIIDIQAIRTPKPLQADFFTTLATNRSKQIDKHHQDSSTMIMHRSKTTPTTTPHPNRRRTENPNFPQNHRSAIPLQSHTAQM